MEINGSFSSPIPYLGIEPQRTSSQTPPGQDTPSPPTRPTAVTPAVKTSQSDVEQQRKRFYAVDRDLPHSARQAINSYYDTDYAGGPEVMNRVDVYA